MITKIALPLAAVAGLSFAIYTVVQAHQPVPPPPLAVTPPTHPDFKAIAGAGLIEARTENIPIGPPVPGVVWEVFAKVHDRVGKGDPLFRLDDRTQQAELKVREAAVLAARAELERLRNAPRPEDLPPAEAAVEQARAHLADMEAAMGRSQRLIERNMIAASDYDKDRFAYYTARAALEKAQADLDRLRKGSWEEDLRVAEARLAQAEAQAEAIRVDLDRMTVRALADGEVLQVNVRPGQFAAMAWKEPMIVLGDVRRLHVRADIDEQDVPFFREGAEAVATLKGRPQVRFPLEFVKVEPYVVPKRSLTGDNSERVDTRVLQVIYALPDERDIPLYVGQQMDVYLKVAPPEGALALEGGLAAPRPFEAEGPAAAPRTAD